MSRQQRNGQDVGLTIKNREFDCQSGCYQVVTTRIGDCLRTGTPSRYTTPHQGQLSLPSLRVGKSSTGLLGWG